MSSLDPNIVSMLLGLLTTGLSSIALQWHWTTLQKQFGAAGIALALAVIGGIINHQLGMNVGDLGVLLKDFAIVFTTAHATYLGIQLAPSKPLTALQQATTLKKTTMTSPPT